MNRYRVRPGRTVRLPNGTVWAEGGQIVEVDESHEWGQRVISPQLNKVRPVAADAEGEVAELPDSYAKELSARGYGTRKLSAEKAPVKRKKASKKAEKAELELPELPADDQPVDGG